MEKETEIFTEMITPIGIDLAKSITSVTILIFYAKDGSTMTFNLDNKSNLEKVFNAFQEIMLIPKCKKILQEAGLMSIKVKEGDTK